MSFDSDNIHIDNVQPRYLARKVFYFKDLLEEYGVTYTEKEFYLQVGEILQVQGWIFHLSVAKSQLEALLRLMIPTLSNKGVPFRIIRDSETASFILDAGLGYYRLGKIVAIYPQDNIDVLAFARQLIALTEGFRGPSIPTDRQLGGIVYTRYGSYNPVIKPGKQGKERYIYNNTMELIADEYVIPYVPPVFVKWPFDEIVPPVPSAIGKLMKNTYKPLFVIKEDTKGRVLKGIYMKGFLNFKHCIIKEGKKDMWLDEYGRDIQDRLTWQYNLSRDLSDDILVPEIFDFFEQQGDLYLAMEFINGDILGDRIDSIYAGAYWESLSPGNRASLFNYLVNIVGVIQKFHERGYIHRDITPANFIIDKKNRIFLIDMELSYSLIRKEPAPPFKLGTVGYMSPEQYAFKEPDVKQDIYAIGALMLYMFTGVFPTKFNIKDTEQLLESILFFNGDKELAELIVKCLHRNPEVRPVITDILAMILCKQGVKERAIHQRDYPPAPSDVDVLQVINSALQGLTVSALLTEDLLWDSAVLFRKDNRNVYIERKYIPDLYDGISGILYCLGKGGAAGYNIAGLIPAYKSCVEYIRSRVSDEYFSKEPGLYRGTAGIALGIGEALHAGLVLPGEAYVSFLRECFSAEATNLDYASGISGQGIALLHCRKWLPSEWVESLLLRFIKKIMERQLKDGSWIGADVHGGGNDKPVGFANGVSGIIYFLLCYVSNYPDEQVIYSIRKALAWLMALSRRKGKTIFWAAGEKSSTYLASRDHGLPGIAVVFVKAYEVLGDQIYRDVAEKALNYLPDFPIGTSLSQAMGLAGLGEIYLKASQVFENKQWRKRADWIAHTLMNLKLTDKENSASWTIEVSPEPVADLMSGSCGVVHFFMYYREPQKIGTLLSINH